MYVIVVGCGRVGRVLAEIVARDGHNVVVIDTDNERFESLDPQFSGVTIAGDGADIDVLREAKIDQADVLVATTGDDSSNLMSAQIARKVFNVPRAMARIKDPQKLDVYRQYDVEAVSATTLAAYRLAEMLKVPKKVETLASIGQGKLVRFRLPTFETCQALSRLMKKGIFSICALITEKGTVLKDLDSKIKPGVEVVGCILTDNIKHLKGLLEP